MNYINHIISTYAAEYTLLDWIPLDKLDWEWLSRNPAAIHLLEKHLDKIEWNYLSINPAAIQILKANPDRINWDYLSSNPSIFRLNNDQIYKVL